MGKLKGDSACAAVSPARLPRPLRSVEQDGGSDAPSIVSPSFIFFREK